MPAVQEQTKAAGTKRLAGKVALVTGGSRGIGKAIALRLAEEGAHVAICYAKSKAGADEVVTQINGLGSKGFAFKADVSSESETKQLIEEVAKAVGQIDILVNNAGVFELAPIQEATVEQYNRLFNVNVQGVVATTIAALKKMKDGGRIINISSVASRDSHTGTSFYSATKAALDKFAAIWAQDLGSRKITVNNVGPGATSTDMLNSGLDDTMKKAMIEKTPLGRLGEPEDIAAVVAFLASEDGRWVTGQTIYADGGLNF